MKGGRGHFQNSREFHEPEVMQICEGLVGSNSQSGHNIQAPMLWLAVNVHKERRKIKSRDIWTPAVGILYFESFFPDTTGDIEC